MKKQINSTIITVLGITGFLLGTLSLGLSLYLNNQMILIGLIPGILFSLLALTLSHIPKKPSSNFVPKNTRIPDESLTDFTPKNNVISDELRNEFVPDNPSPEILSETFTIELEIDEKTAEALLRLSEKMKKENLIYINHDFDFDNKGESDIFLEAFKPIPVIGLVKNRYNNYNILGGLTHDSVEVIGNIKQKDLLKVQDTYQNAQNIKGLIVGGKYKTQKNSVHTQAHRVHLTFYFDSSNSDIKSS